MRLTFIQHAAVGVQVFAAGTSADLPDSVAEGLIGSGHAVGIDAPDPGPATVAPEPAPDTPAASAARRRKAKA